jgi:hypothetical protein
VFGGIERERWDKVWVPTVTDKASSGMGVESNHEKESEMVCIPENLKTLMTDLVM